MLRRINISAAMIVIICFLLPWEQISCGGAKDTLSGLDLARHDHVSLWLVPLLMLAVVVIGTLRRRGERPLLFSILSVIAGSVAMYLMNDERQRVQDEAGIISAHLTGWFWLSFFASLAVFVLGVIRLFSRSRSPAQLAK
jgi:hypothetical protein